MDLKAFLSMVFFTIVASRAPTEEEFYVHNHTDDYVDYEYDEEPKNVQTDTPTNVASATNKPVASYEVTENVDDIPNNVTYTGPVVANFTIKIPHNNATVVRNNTNTINNSNNEIDKDNFDIFNGFGDTDHHSYKENKNEKNYSINIFHVNAKYDNHTSTVQNVNINKFPNFGSFKLKEHVDRFKDSVVDLIHNVKNTDSYNNVNHGFVVPNVVAGPIAFINKLHKKGSAVTTKLHDVIFGYFNDY